MKYHIDTIPLWDAINTNSECMFCTISRHIELQKVEKYLGASLMDPNTRIEVNKSGFCQKHLKMLNDSGINKLGVALLLHSILTDQKPVILSSIEQAKKRISLNRKSLITVNSKNISTSIEKTITTINKASDSCIICYSINKTMQRYYKTFFHLWKNDTEYHEKFLKSKGICLPHIASILEFSKSSLSKKEQIKFLEEIYELTAKSLETELFDLNHFIKKYDYRSNELPWGNSKDSVERTTNKLEGWCVGKEPNPEDRIKK